MFVTVIVLKHALLVQWPNGHFLKLTDSAINLRHLTQRVTLYPQNGDHIVTIDSVVSHHPVYFQRKYLSLNWTFVYWLGDTTLNMLSCSTIDWQFVELLILLFQNSCKRFVNFWILLKYFQKQSSVSIVLWYGILITCHFVVRVQQSVARASVCVTLQ